MPSDAAPLIVRTLDLLARGHATGTVVATSASRTGSISMVAGRIVHVEAPGAAPLLCELLGIDREHASPGAVLGAHREQMRTRLAAMLGWRGVAVAFRAGSPRAAPGVEPAHTADLVVEALRRAAQQVPAERCRDRLKAHAWSLTTLGRSLTTRAALHADEAALVAALAAPLDLAGIERIAKADRALRFVYALTFVEAVALPSETGAMTLLARKATELRRAAAPNRLLDLPPHARPAEARGALRRFARELHPDRFAAHAPAGIQEASTAVVAAMTRAAATIR